MVKIYYKGKPNENDFLAPNNKKLLKKAEKLNSMRCL